MDSKKLTSKEKKLKRREELAKKKVVDKAIKTAYARQDHLADFPAFHKYDRNGLLLHLEYGTGAQLTSLHKNYIQELLKLNMEGPYGSEWPSEQKIKRREMVSLEACYIFVRKILDNAGDNHKGLWAGEGEPLVAFVQYRFIVEEEIPVVYVYELQLEECVQRRGLGKFLMQLIELIAQRYAISSISPSQVDPLIGAEKSYEILCKTFDSEAKDKLEETLF